MPKISNDCFVLEIVIPPPFYSLALVCCPRTLQVEKFDGVELSSIQNPAKHEILELKEVLI